MTTSKPSAEILSELVAATSVACAYRESAASDWQITPGLASVLGLAANWTSWNDKNFSDRVHQEDQSTFIDARQNLLASATTFETALRLRHENGSWRWFNCRGLARGSQYFIALNDETQARQERAALVDSQLRLRSIYDATPIAIILWNREGCISDWNNVAESVFGYPRAKVVGQKLTPLLIAPEEYERFSSSLSAAVKGNSLSQVVCRSLTAAGEGIMCDWRTVALRGPKGTLIGLLSLALDVTAALAAESTLRLARDQAQSLSQAKSELLTIISHELRTPLNGVLGMAQLLEMSLEEPELEYAQTIQRSGEELLAIVNGIIEYTELDARSLEDSREEIIPSELLTSIIERYTYNAQRKNLTLNAQLDDALWQPMLGDRSGFEKVINILLDNAVKFTQSGGLNLQLDIESERAKEVILRCAITDTGVGIAPEQLEHLYVPFKQGAADASVRKHGGVGLGLALAKKVLDRLGGTINVQSVVGEGSTFTITVPFSRP